MSIQASSDKDLVQVLSIEFRRAIVEAHKNHKFIGTNFEDFPSGCCFLASVLLARFLSNYKICTRISIANSPNNRKFDQRQTHAWLEYENLIIDITANQFDENIESVVFEKTKSFHDDFTCIKTSDFENDSYDVGPYAKSEIPILTKIIQQYLCKRKLVAHM